MADKPSRALVLYGDAETEDERIVREFAHLLDASEAYTLASGLKANGSENEISTLSERFMGIMAALVTDNSSLTSFGKMIGLDVLQLNEIHQKSDDSFSSDATATELLRLLGFEGGKCLDMSLYDSVFVHIGGDNVGTVDSLIGSIMRMSQPGSETASRLHLSVVLSYGSVTDKDVSVFPVKNTPQEGINPAFQGLVPRQSYTMRGEKTRDNVRDYCPMLVAQWQDAVTRKDLVDTLSFEALKKLSGSLVIPADRFIHEVAFKLWKAPKYGA
uniref:Putative rhomboid family protein n=1 Tax=Brassica napus TaxID=3708 RepID=I7DAE9_BRANA|nr:putative rhomboid family protein [Brassica napus]